MSAPQHWQTLLADPGKAQRLSPSQLLGLEEGDVDPQRVQQSLREAAKWLQAHRSSFDAAGWQTVTTAFQAAKRALAPTLASGPTAPPSQTPPSQTPHVIAPLRGGDPFAPLERPAAAVGASARTAAAGPATSVADSGEIQLPDDLERSVLAAIPAPARTRPRSVARRRRFGPTLMMGLLIAGLFGGLLYAIKLLMDREAQQQLAAAQRSAERSLLIPTIDRPTQTPVVGRPTDDRAKPPDEAAWNQLRQGTDSAVEAGEADAAGSGERVTPAAEETQMSIDPASPTDDPETAAADSPDRTESMADDPASGDTADMSDRLSAENQAKAEAAWQELRDHLRAGDISASVTAAATAESLITDPERRELLARWRQIIEYAEIYQEAIDQGLGKWGVAESLRVGGKEFVLVQLTDEQLVIKLDGRQQTFPRGELKLGIADAVAALAIDPQHPTSRAYRAAYLLLRFAANDPAARRAALAQWEQAASESDEVAVMGIAQAIDSLYNP